MSKIFDKLIPIFQDVFDDDILIVNEKTKADDIEEWDSLNHINLVSAIEKEFEIRFALGELMTLKDVGAMIDLMVEKLK